MIESGEIFTSVSKNNPKVVANERKLNTRWNVVKTFMVWGKRQRREKMLRFLFLPAYGRQSEMRFLLAGHCFAYLPLLQCKILILDFLVFGGKKSGFLEEYKTWVQ